MKIENRPYSIRWNSAKTQEGLEFQQVIGSWSIPPSEFTRLLESPIAKSYRQKTLDVLTEGWEEMAAVLTNGGMTTGLGAVYHSFELPVPLPSSLASILSRQGIYTDQARYVEEEFFIDLQQMNIRKGQQVNFIEPNFNKRMTVDPTFGPMYKNFSDKLTPMSTLSRSFTNLFSNLYAQADIPPVVASLSAANSMLGYIGQNEQI